MAGNSDKQGGTARQPQGTAVAPQGTAVAPQGTAVAPQGTAVAGSQGTAVAPQGTTAARNAAAALRGAAAGLKGGGSGQKADGQSFRHKPGEVVRYGGRNYTVKKQLGRGSEGELYIVADNSKRYALKCLDKGFTVNDKVMFALKRLAGKG